MGIGVVGIQTSQKKEQSGAPFASGSAHNGTSIDTTGKVVLGNNVGEAGSPAQLTSDREIITEDALFNLFALVLNSIVTGTATRMDGQTISIIGGFATNTFINIISGDFGNSQLNIVSSTTGGNAVIVMNSATSRFEMFSNADHLTISPTGSGHVLFTVQGFIDVWSINTTTFFTQIGPTLVNDNGATLQITGTTTYRYLQQGQGAGAYNIDRDLDSGKLFTNSAAATFNLFNSVGANFRGGFIFRLNIANAAGGTVQAQVGEVIRFGSLSTSVGGTISSTDVGACITLVLTTGGWVTESFIGAWVLT